MIKILIDMIEIFYNGKVTFLKAFQFILGYTTTFVFS